MYTLAHTHTCPHNKTCMHTAAHVCMHTDRLTHNHIHNDHYMEINLYLRNIKTRWPGPMHHNFCKRICSEKINGNEKCTNLCFLALKKNGYTLPDDIKVQLRLIFLKKWIHLICTCRLCLTELKLLMYCVHLCA